MKDGIATLAELAAFDEIIDVRSPAEYAEDHIPGAINCPVLDNAQRAQVGTLYTQVSPFEAKKIGAALVAENIARHLKERFLDRGKTWRPLIYCWRGGNRSGAMVTIFRAIGWRAGQLEGGYKTYRRQVLDDLQSLPRQFGFRVLCGPTGSAKTRLLQALAAAGEQVLDLEALACHKGSVLGVLPDCPQPTQKALESAILASLRDFDPERPVYVEAESRKIGRLRLPDALFAAMQGSPCLAIEAPVAARVDFLLRDYAYFVDDPEWLKRRLEALVELHGRERVAAWAAWIDGRDWRHLVADLLERHYDPLYKRSLGRDYSGFSSASRWPASNLSMDDISRLAASIAGTVTGNSCWRGRERCA